MNLDNFISIKSRKIGKMGGVIIVIIPAYAVLFYNRNGNSQAYVHSAEIPLKLCHTEASSNEQKRFVTRTNNNIT